MNDDNNTQQPILNHLSLCTGYEGIGQGLRRVLPPLREIAYSEIEDYAIANLVTKIEEGRLHPAPIFTNLKTIPYRKFLGKVSVLSGGFPCQGFSHAGLRKGVDDPRHLYPFIAEGISQCKPTFAFLENVSGIISATTHDGQSVLHYVCQDLESRGYKVSWGVFSASEVGLPHERKRVFILGISNTENLGCRGRYSSSIGKRDGSILSREQEGRKMVSQTEGCSGDIFQTKELGNTKCERPLIIGDETEVGSESREMGSQRCEYTSTFEHSSTDSSRKELVNSNCKGFQGQPQRQEWISDDAWSPSKWLETKVPARPNEPQHEWEYPRVITKGIPQPKLGGTTDGFRHRDNRLRLCGNGVVPAVAAKAFITLLQKNLTN